MEHLQILLGAPKQDPWAREWHGWKPGDMPADIWARNARYWPMRGDTLARFWATNHVVTLVVPRLEVVVAVAHVQAVLRVELLDPDLPARYLNRVSFEGELLPNHEMLGEPWHPIPLGAREWPTWMVPGQISLPSGEKAIAV